MKFLIIKPTRCTNFSNLFWSETLRVSDSSSVHHQEFFTAHTAMVYVIQACWQLASCQQTYTTAVCTVKNSWWRTEELSETCRVSLQNKFEKLVHLVGFIIRNLSRCTVTWTSNRWKQFCLMCMFQLLICSQYAQSVFCLHYTLMTRANSCLYQCICLERHNDTCRPCPLAKQTNDDIRTFYERKILKHQLPASKG
jgi:hypothetical protein